MNETTTMHETATEHAEDLHEQVDDHHGDHDDHGHPSDGDYIKIALLLGFLTAVEVGTYFVEGDVSDTLLYISLTVLMVVKFAIVGLYFMHLKFDSKVYTWMFTAGLILAMAVYAIMLLSQSFFG